MNSLRYLLVCGAVLMTSASAGHAGQKLYDMDSILRESQARLDRLSVARENTPPAAVQSPAPAPARRARYPFVSELVIGGWYHDPGEDNNESDTWDFNAEIIFRKVGFFEIDNRFARFLLEPRPVLGGSINNENETHTVYLGLNWTYNFRSGVFIGLSLTPTYHTGNLEQATRQCAPIEPCLLPGNRAYVNTGEVTLGSQFLFRESLDIGYRFGRHGISAFAAHISNAGLDNDNDGMNFLGVRYSFAFDKNLWN